MFHARETLDVTKISALSRVCESFASACEVNNLGVVEAWQGIGRILGLDQGENAGVRKTATAVSGPPVAISREEVAKAIALSPHQVATAKQLFLQSKAARLGVSVSEVNLTSEEVNQAKATYRLKLAEEKLGLKPQPSPPPKEVDQVGPLSMIEALRIQSGRKDKNPYDNPVQQEPSSTKMKTSVDPNPLGDRSTAETRIKNLRRNLLRKVPWILEEPCVLHLTSYANERLRLAKQWSAFKIAYEHSGLQDPLRNLPDPWSVPAAAKKLLEVAPRLRRQDSDPDLFLFQTPDSKSYWEQDRPSRDCPDFLAFRLSDLIIGQLERSAE
jgi:hypothetical protein